MNKELKEALYTDRTPCFICDSDTDAAAIRAAAYMAALEADAARMNCRAISVSDTELLAAVTSRQPICVLILAYDNSRAGNEHAAQVAAALNDTGQVRYITAEYNKLPPGLHLDEIDTRNKEQLADLAADIKAIYLKAWQITRQEIEKHNAFNYLIDMSDLYGSEPQPTGFVELDKALDGGLYPGLYILGAISSIGKTALILQMADQIAATGKTVLYFTLEMGARELIARSISRYTYMLADDERNAATVRSIMRKGLQLDVWQADTMDTAQRQYISDTADRLYYYESVGDIGIQDIKEAVEAHYEITGKLPAAIFIDYMQILRPYNMRWTDKQNTDKAVTELKKLARDENIPVFAISSLNRGSYHGDIQPDAFKESGAIEYGSDVLLALQVPELDTGTTPKEAKANKEKIDSEIVKPVRELELKVLKNRNGATRQRIRFTYNAKFNHFTDQTADKPTPKATMLRY